MWVFIGRISAGCLGWRWENCPPLPFIFLFRIKLLNSENSSPPVTVAAVTPSFERGLCTCLILPGLHLWSVITGLSLLIISLRPAWTVHPGVIWGRCLLGRRDVIRRVVFQDFPLMPEITCWFFPQLPGTDAKTKRHSLQNGLCFPCTIKQNVQVDHPVRRCQMLLPLI